MGWWPFGGATSTKNTIKSEYDAFVPPPHAGSPFAEPPTAPQWMNTKELSKTPFTGFSEPPPVPSLGDTSTSNDSTRFFNFPFSTSKKEDYSPSELKKYASLYNESDGLNDEKYIRLDNASSWADRIFTSPRSRNCYESIKMGLAMGGAVGGIFGGLTGLYASVVHRSILIFPISIAGGALSFGFFLGCGMIVRCDGPVRNMRCTPNSNWLIHSKNSE